MGQVLGADMVKDATNTMMSVGSQGIVNRGLETLRQKGTMESNQFNFEREMYRDNQRLLGEQLNFDRNFKREDARMTAQNDLRKAEITAAEERARQEQLAKEARDKTEYERRVAEANKAKAEADKKASDKEDAAFKGLMTGLETTWQAADESTTDWADMKERDRTEYSVDADGNEVSNVIREKGSDLRDRVNAHFADIKKQLEGMGSSAEKSAYLERLKGAGLLDFGSVRSLYDPAFRKKMEEEKAAKAKAGAGGGTTTITVTGGATII